MPKLITREAKEFSSDLKPEHEEAGIKIFEKFGPLNILESISQGDVTKWATIKAMTFETIMNKRRLDRDKTIFSEKLNDIMIAKSKNR